ncbi:amidophosphoribosyltransferase [Bacilli bacterium PM5-3]|nr:amidophosphoribosyltransferase [Bacilli bacterium PM5-3]MDH6603287.1 amidophosphoribosyltransferase [Bacilli bacterium PM5-9]
MFDIKGLNEECGVFAVSNNKNAITLSYYGLHCLQHRGQEGAGIAFRKDNDIDVVKGKGLVADVLTSEVIASNSSTEAIAHVRYATEGGLGLANVQPFSFKFFDESIALAHNGHIGNAKLLKRNLEAKGSVFSSTSDSEILIHLLRNESGSFHERLVSSLIKLDGAFAYVMLHNSGLYGIRDRHGLRPLSIGQLEDDSYVLTSETCVFSVIGAKFIRDVEPGEIVRIYEGQIESSFYAKDTSQNMCLMEYVYFSRPDSSLDGTNVHFARKLSGKILAQESGIDADIVVGVPDSSTSAAIGYAEATGIPYEMGLIKNRYVGRTFIQPTQELREKGVRMKLSAVSEIVGGKRIVLIDDSIVRGTTSKRIVQLLKEAGAKEVHVRIASPAIKYPCYYGVDISTYEELISNRLNVEELAEFIKADSLAFLSLEGLENALLTTKYGKECKCDQETRYCTACFNGNYVTSLYESVECFNIDKKKF